MSTTSEMLARPLKRQRRPAKRFVGDVLQILPYEIADDIFAYCEPGDIFRLRNVSRLWNEYLSRPEVLQRMDMEMYAHGGQYQVKSDNVYAENASFEDRVRHRYALLNAHAYSFEHVNHESIAGYDIQFRAGVILGVSEDRLIIYVKRLYQNDTDWHTLVDIDDYAFELVKLTPKHVLAVTTEGAVYCWAATIATFQKVAGFDISPQPYMIDASANTIVMYCGDEPENVRVLYSIDNNIMTRRMTDDRPDPLHYSIDQSGFIYRRHDDFIPRRCFELSRFNDMGTDIDSEQFVDYYEYGRYHLNFIREQEGLEPLDDEDDLPFNVILVWDYKLYHLTQTNPNEPSCLVFELRDGRVEFCHIIHHQDSQILLDLVYLPQLHLAFKSEFDETKDIPAGIFRIHGSSYRPVTPNSHPDLFNSSAHTTEYTTERLQDIDWGMADGDGDPGDLRTDGNFIICTASDGLFSKVWNFCRTNEGQFTGENSAQLL